jgi:hypothetical protein
MVFIESRIFSARLEELAGKSAADVLSQIQRDLILNPEKGSLLHGLGGMRKARSSNPARSKGKRGGFRYFYMYLQNRQHIHLLLLLDKNEQADITNAELKALKRLVDAVKQ